MTLRSETPAPESSLEVRERLVEALRLDLVGPWARHALAEELLPGRARPWSGYLTGFLIPWDAPSEQGAGMDEDEDPRALREAWASLS